jgi:hypothetical protein
MSLLDPPSPDSTGIAYKPGADQLLISDSEVDEMSIFQGVNLFELTKTGTLTESSVTTGFSDEPTGISYRRSDGMLFVSDDDRNEIYLVLPGLDGRHGTVDDVVDSFDTSVFGSTDPEGVAFDTATGALFIIDGDGRKVYRVSPGANGVFDGVPPGGDDGVSSFDVGEFGATDPAGIAYDAAHDHLLVVDGGSDAVYELTKTGFLANTIDITAANPVRAAGIVLAPGSNDPGMMNMYIVDRGVDNDNNPLENDGRLYEMSADLGRGRFSDDDFSIFEDDIEWMVEQDITKGCNPPANDLFCPDDVVTRGQLAAFLVRALGYTDDGGGNLFVDDDNSIFEGDIDRLGTAGVTRGCNPPVNNRYCPDDVVTRGQMAAFLVRALGYTDDGGGNLFIDDDGSVFEGDIDKLGTAGVTKGCNPPVNDKYCPGNVVTRGQMAAFLHRALG